MTRLDAFLAGTSAVMQMVCLFCAVVAVCKNQPAWGAFFIGSSIMFRLDRVKP
ncbi:hypothetical protein METEAL_15450 [Mesoterricola silvestris]|uniref:Uncharacterized protein n=1 Tax=Mesoterricola silvestris TaxID=2927979 RepID=A0AA48GGI0_9BACT|nr:hypothetical protein METEAL_15450 [Mesoterricola silvestris]